MLNQSRFTVMSCKAPEQHMYMWSLLSGFMCCTSLELINGIPMYRGVDRGGSKGLDKPPIKPGFNNS